MANDAAVTAGGAAEAPDAAGVYRIYPGNGVPPGSEGWTWGEQVMAAPWNTSRRMVRNVVVPTLTVFKPAKPNGTSMVIAPGGAFHFLMVDHEGYDLARWATERGITAFVLKYRVMRTPDRDDEMLAFREDLTVRLQASRKASAPHPSPLTEDGRLWAIADGRQAMRWVRERAGEFGIDPGRIGLAGFSAGGGLAVGVALEHEAESRPDFVCAVYPPHHLLQVPNDAAPLFLIISDDDLSVAPETATRLYEAWHAAGKAAELHIFGNGGHGWGMGKGGHLSDIWITLFDNWLRVRGLIA